MYERMMVYLKWVTTDEINQAILKSKQQELDRWRIVRYYNFINCPLDTSAKYHQLWHDGYLAGLKEAKRIISRMDNNLK